MRSDTPAEMSCDMPEVSSCSTTGVLATCQLDEFVLHLTMYVYSTDLLSEAEESCADSGGTWTPADES